MLLLEDTMELRTRINSSRHTKIKSFLLTSTLLKILKYTDPNYWGKTAKTFNMEMNWLHTFIHSFKYFSIHIINSILIFHENERRLFSLLFLSSAL